MASDTIFECPITKVQIVNFTMTCVGSVYEKSAIQKWLQEHPTDPLTNLVLPTQLLFDVEPPFTLENIQKQSSQLRANMRNGWGTLSTVSRLMKHKEVHKMKKVIKMRKAVDNFKDKDLWCLYSNAIFDLIINSDSNLQTELVTIALEKTGIELISSINFAIDAKISVKSPRLSTLNPQLGCGMQFLDLSTWKNLDQSPIIIKTIKKVLPMVSLHKFSRMVSSVVFPKGLTMIGTNLSGIIFYDCSFFRTDFSYANLKDVYFVNCRFSGEQLVFHQTIWDNNTSFIDCLMESFNNHETKLVDEFQLLARGFEINDVKKPFIKNRRSLIPPNN